MATLFNQSLIEGESWFLYVCGLTSIKGAVGLMRYRVDADY